tara:strand:+ start:234 stop:584 length:351 start_codon:yes stop_codon:yes gene_type:complete
MDLFLLINDSLKIIVGVSIFFVWVVRYNNIIDEFKQYQLPDWLRDMVGIFKLSFAVMIQSPSVQLVLIGSGGIAVLMGAALLTHFRVNTPYFKRLPSLLLMIICLMLFTLSVLQQN